MEGRKRYLILIALISVMCVVSPAAASGGKPAATATDKPLLGILPAILNISVGQGLAVNASLGGGSAGASNLSILLNLSQGPVVIPSSGELLNLSAIGPGAQNGTQASGASPIAAGQNGYSNPGISLVNVTLATAGQNVSWSNDAPGVSRIIAHNRIAMLLKELGLVKVQVQESDLGDTDKAKLIDNSEKNVQWLKSKDEAIQAGDNLSAVREGIAGAEPGMALIRSGLRVEAGLLACENMDAWIADATRTSSTVKEKAGSPNVKAADKAWYTTQLAVYDGHIRNASSHVANAREAFLMVSETSGYDARYEEGIGELKLAQGEKGEAYIVLKDIFGRMAEAGII